MGMVWEARRVDAATYGALKAAPDEQTYDLAFPEELYGTDAEKDLVDVDKAWHAIHFMLSGKEWGGDLPLGFLQNGEPLSEDLGYGPLLGLTPDVVAEIANHLDALAVETFMTRFDAKAFCERNIYPEIWDRDDPETKTYIADNYVRLRAFFLAARAENQAVVQLVG